VAVVPEGQLVYGIQLPVQALSVMTSMPWEREAGVDDLRRAALAAEAAGFFYVAICDHVAIPRDKAETMSTTWFNPVATLGWIAGQTQRVRLMTNVYVAAYRHPLETAKMFATLDHLSGGRVILGVGAGHVEGEFEALGISFADRGRLTNEAIDGVLDAWTHEYVGEVGLRPRPAQAPRPPIWIGGSSKAALRRVAERGDGWIPQGTPRQLMPDSIAYLREQRDAVRPGEPVDIGMITEHIHVGEAGWDVPKYTLSGAPDRIAESLNEYGAMGISHLQLRFASRSIDELCDQMARFGAEVAPSLTR
jgi:probable F420-dependent oxidoreductase